MDGRVAVVTGGGSGIGQASALLFAQAGASVVVADARDDAARATADLIARAGGAARAVRADVTVDADVAAMVATALDAFGRLDYAHNNAGVSGTPSGVVACTDEEWDRTLAVNLTGVWRCMKHEVPALRAAGGGSIVNTASGAGLVGFAGLPAYVASKHGVIGLTKSAALELITSGIRVNAVCPGATRTAMIEQYLDADPAFEKLMTAGTPARRFASAGEIAAAVVWLCSDAASFVTGVALPVDGGAVAM